MKYYLQVIMASPTFGRQGIISKTSGRSLQPSKMCKDLNTGKRPGKTRKTFPLIKDNATLRPGVFCPFFIYNWKTRRSRLSRVIVPFGSLHMALRTSCHTQREPPISFLSTIYKLEIISSFCPEMTQPGIKHGKITM